ncbi:MAG: DUF1800 domain-containing protein [Candidatus Pedobacter colombiensis]|uniref:DUF1800 domain-containing protein n=1 Tax=Candidatus Pedobacter colombiensis TaxID=3121371 RepID=A0AAJ5WBC4_9SPHI|nr:DUF1800 domain-containing protein [Pedobacter sp.]WEK21427.1 MAG: DUF1800 domain-containing protein [Pedobacter sp.]
MRTSAKVVCLFVFLFIATIFCTAFQKEQPGAKSAFPYKHAGLNKRQAAAHLLNRFTYGATPGQVDEVVAMGLENWFNKQLEGNLADDALRGRLSGYDAIQLSNTEVLREYPPGFVVVQMALKDSIISKDSVGKAVDKKAYNEKIQAYMASKGLKSDQDLYKQFISQHILRAAYTNNQLQEVMSDFWFNHFNVSFTKGECAQFIPAYERDVIRPNALGKFDQLLIASAKSPAMLYYLDNFTSQGAAAPVSQPAMGMMMAAEPPKNVPGLNENYAREVMELHTLGVDGGYTQSDVTQAARVLTGWTIYPISSTGYGSAMKGLVAKIGESNLAAKGFVHEGDFLFTPTRHDKGEKVVLGKRFEANGGYEEGVALLEMLAHHPSTANFISRKLAVRFVSDNPPASLIRKMAKTFTTQDGDIRQVLLTMVNSPEFWDTKALRQKTKSPFELAMSSVRAINADIQQPYQLFNWISRMGQRIYYYQAPTGFPDRGQYWINTGSLLNRMNFGLALSSGRIPGVVVNLAALNPQKETESAGNILASYSKMMLPEQKLDPAYKEVIPLLQAPAAAAATNNEMGKPAVVSQPAFVSNKFSGMDAVSGAEELNDKKKEVVPVANNNILAQVVGIIIGSPEFQRR